MALFLATAPTDEPLTLEAVKLHLRVTSSSEDEYIDSLITAARQYVETFTHRALPTQTWDLKLDAFPGGEIELPSPPVTAITSITYVDTAGVSQVWASSNYITDLPTGPWAQRARIAPAYAINYPSTRAIPNAVIVRFVCGYGSSVPEGMKAAMKLLIGHWYANREAVNIGNITSEVPVTVDALLWPFKAF